MVSDIPQHRETMGDLAFYFDGIESSILATTLGQAADVLKLNEEDIIKELVQHVIANFSHSVIAKQWDELLSNLTAKIR